MCSNVNSIFISFVYPDWIAIQLWQFNSINKAIGAIKQMKLSDPIAYWIKQFNRNSIIYYIKTKIWLYSWVHKIDYSAKMYESIKLCNIKAGLPPKVYTQYAFIICPVVVTDSNPILK